MRRLNILLVLWALTGCKPQAPVAATESRIVVCATVYPLADVAREIGGSHLRLDWILDLGDPMSGFALNSNERHRLTGVDFVVCDGQRSDSWAQTTIRSLDETGSVLTLEKLPVARTTPPSGALWLDPVVVRELVGQLNEKFTIRRPQYRDDFAAGAKSFTDRLDAILRDNPNSAFGDATVVTLSPLFDPLLNRFGIRSMMIESDALRLRNTDVQRIRQTAKDHGIRAMVLPFDAPPGTISDIEARTGLRVFLIDPVGLPQFPNHSTYLEILKYNLAQLRAAAAVKAQG